MRGWLNISGFNFSFNFKPPLFFRSFCLFDFFQNECFDIYLKEEHCYVF